MGERTSLRNSKYNNDEDDSDNVYKVNTHVIIMDIFGRLLKAKIKKIENNLIKLTTKQHQYYQDCKDYKLLWWYNKDEEISELSIITNINNPNIYRNCELLKISGPSGWIASRYFCLEA